MLTGADLVLMLKIHCCPAGSDRNAVLGAVESGSSLTAVVKVPEMICVRSKTGSRLPAFRWNAAGLALTDFHKVSEAKKKGGDCSPPGLGRKQQVRYFRPKWKSMVEPSFKLMRK